MYGILISLGSIGAFFIVEGIVKKRELDLRIFYNSINAAIIFALLGARLYHVIHYWSLYKNFPFLIIQVWKGGLGIFGALIGGVIGIYISLTKAGVKRKEMLEWLDIFAVGIPFIQAIGRWGNYFNKEIQGTETSLPWALKMEGKFQHPLFLYESVLNFILFLILLWMEKRQQGKGIKKGTILFSYLLGYGLIRFFLEFLRVESWKINGINVAQGISIILIIGSIAFLSSNLSINSRHK